MGRAGERERDRAVAPAQSPASNAAMVPAPDRGRLRALAQHLAPDTAGARGEAPPHPSMAAGATHDAADDLRLGVLSPEQWRHYATEGYVVVKDIFPPSLIASATAAARRLRQRVRDGSLIHGFMHRTGVAAEPWAPPTGSTWAAGAAGPWEEPWSIRGLLSTQHDEPSFGQIIGTERLQARPSL